MKCTWLGIYDKTLGGDVKIVSCQRAQFLVCNSAAGRKLHLSIFYDTENTSIIPCAYCHEIPAGHPVIPVADAGALNAFSLVKGHGLPASMRHARGLEDVASNVSTRTVSIRNF